MPEVSAEIQHLVPGSGPLALPLTKPRRTARPLAVSSVIFRGVCFRLWAWVLRYGHNGANPPATAEINEL